MTQIFRKEGWMLNPNDKVVNAILKGVERNNGECPCHNDGYDKHCPCSDYREKEKLSQDTVSPSDASALSRAV